MLNLGLIGAGRIGRIHANNLAHRIPQAHLRMVVDLHEAAARACAETLNIPQSGTDHRALLQDPDIDAVVICSATDTHAQFIEEAALAGKHMFCEKPIDHDLRAIDRALAVVEQAGIKLQIGFNRRFDPSFSRVREAIRNGDIGEPHLFHIISRDPGPPPLDYIRSSGGLFHDMTIHDFDMARFLMDAEVETVYASGAVRVDPAIGEAGDIDTALILLTFENGAMGTIDNSRKAVYGYDQRVEVFGSKGSISTQNHYPNQATLSTAHQIQRDLPLHFFLERYADSYLLEMQDFVNCIKNNTPPSVSAQDGRVPVLMARAAQRSMQEKRPIRLDEVA